MRDSDSIPILLILTAFVLMFIGERGYEHLAEAWVIVQITPWLGAGEAEVVDRFFALALAALISIYVTAGLYLRLRRNFARQVARIESGGLARRPRRDVWLYDGICRIFLGRWETIALKGGKLSLNATDAPVLRDLVSRHIRQLAAEGTLPIWGKQRGSWALWELAPPEFWKHHQVDFQSFLEADPKLLHALPCHSNGGRPAPFGELMTSKAAVDAFCESVAL